MQKRVRPSLRTGPAQGVGAREPAEPGFGERPGRAQKGGGPVPTSHESFQRRVSVLRDSWAERRALKGLGSTGDFDSQYGLLLTLYRWADEATADIRNVYGDSLAVNISPTPERDGSAPAFVITLGDNYTVTFVLSERTRMGSPRWSIAVTLGAGGPGGSIAAAGPDRRNSQWTRGRLEDILLSVLGAYERAVSEGGGWPPPASSLRPRGA